MGLFVHLLGAWFATEAAAGRYPRPVALGIGVLVSRLGVPATLLALAGVALKRLHDEGAFEPATVKSRPARRRP